MTPLTEDGRPMCKCDEGWADPDCVACHGTGHVGFGSEAEACECFLGSGDVLSAREFCPPVGEP